MARRAQEDASDNLRDAFAPSASPEAAAGQPNLPYEIAYSQAVLPGANPDLLFQDEVSPQPAQTRQPRELRDAFAPADPDKADDESDRRDAVGKRPFQPRRMALVLLLLCLALVCAVKGGDLISLLMNNDVEVKQAREDYKQSNGGDLYSDAQRVALLPAGQTYAPTQTPLATQAPQMPSPTPVFTFNEAAMNHQSNRSDASQPSRTRLSVYPGNELHNMLPSVIALREENKEIVGRLVIEGVLDEVVTQRNNNTYYLTHNYRGANSEAGAVFVDKACTLSTPPENLLLRGQGAVEGKVFAPLWQYVTGGIEFASAHATVRLTSLYEEKDYMLLSVIRASNDPSSPDYFDFSNHPAFSTDEAFFQYVQAAQARSLYPVNLGVSAGDRLLTLATVGGDSCLVLIFKMV